jgi:PTH1 family peptidyl-tRNA hydrolase
MNDPWLVVGLGNPGEEYARTRHNVGFRVVDELARRAGTTFERRDRAYDVAEFGHGGATRILLRPRTYMNRSGDAVRAWARDAGRVVTGAPEDAGAGTPAEAVMDAPDDIAPAAAGERAPLRPVVVCDDLALPLGALRIRGRGSDGGQKGLASIIAAIGGREFPRVRLGVGDPAREIPPEDWADFVLANFAPDEEPLAAELVAHAADALAVLLDEGWELAASRFNRRQPPADAADPSDDPR